MVSGKSLPFWSASLNTFECNLNLTVIVHKASCFSCFRRRDTLQLDTETVNESLDILWRCRHLSPFPSHLWRAALFLSAISLFLPILTTFLYHNSHHPFCRKSTANVMLLTFKASKLSLENNRYLSAEEQWEFAGGWLHFHLVSMLCSLMQQMT